MRSDAELLEAWREGDTDSGEALFERHFEAMLRFFRNKVGPECEELVQRTFMACLEKRDRLREAASFRAFLFGIARFELLRHFRGKHRRDQEIDLADASVYDLDPSPSRVVGRREEERLLLDALRHLPIDLQIVLELHYWEQLSMIEIGEIVGIPVGTVKTRLRAARKRLLDIIETMPVEPDVRRSTVMGLDRWVEDVRGHVGRRPEV